MSDDSPNPARRDGLRPLSPAGALERRRTAAMHCRLALLILGMLGADMSSAACSFEAWTTYRSTRLLKHPEVAAYIFRTDSVKVDADGAPNAYHPDDVHLNCTRGRGFKGLDCPANAGYPIEDWWPTALVPDPADPKRPFVQPNTAAFAGYFVSQTSLTDKSKQRTDPARYVDSRNVPYLVFPGMFHSMKGTGGMGDLGYAINFASGKSSPFVVAEVGPPNAELGEISIALAAALGGTNPNPRTGAGVPTGKTLFVVFPKSRLSPPWPLAAERLSDDAHRLLQSIGGEAALDQCRADP